MSSVSILGTGESTRFPFGVVQNPFVASGSADVLPIRSGNVFVTRAGVDAMTLATPKAGTYGNVPTGIGEPADDGKVLLVYDTTGNAHTITTAANKINGNKHIATFAGTIGNYIRLISFGGIWYVLDSAGITLS
jgi:hypothetical protein